MFFYSVVQLLNTGLQKHSKNRKRANNNNNNNNNNNSKTMFMVLSSWQSHCESSLLHLMNVERRQAAADPRPSQMT